MIPVIYYAHSLTIYNTWREQEELALLHRYFYNGLIYNPNRDFIQYHKAPMKACFQVLKEPCITGLCFSHTMREISAGVYAEIRVAQKRKLLIYSIDNFQVYAFAGKITLTKKDRKTNWAKVEYASKNSQGYYLPSSR